MKKKILSFSDPAPNPSLKGRGIAANIAFIILAIFVLSSAPLAAEEIKVTAAEIKVSEEACRFVTRHVPNADVAFKPAVDVHGKKVVPADINASPINADIEKLIRIRITNDAAKIFGLKVPEVKKGNETLPLARPEVEGFITLKNGVPYLGDKPLENEQQRQLAVLCGGLR